ncbi:MAG: GDP-L-fucose synthase [Actinobacteria bacterium]|nr:GDP-L-fucose synthase [Actinomycetota bacterium]MDQ3533241.1 GDP-L-fucose synthase [Actinomycetota bacterium]
MSGFWSSRKVLVTGGSGFLGSVVLEKLAQRHAAEVVVPRSRDYDLTRVEEVRELFDDVAPDLVIHGAAQVGGIGANLERPADLYVSNLLMGTFILQETCRRGVAKTVLLGTICSYPKFAPVPFSEESLWDGYPEETNAPYGIAKKALLVHAHANREQYGQKVIYLLPTNLYGPGDKFDPAVSHVIPALIRKFVEAKEDGSDHVVVWGSGRATREFLYVDDAAEGIVLAAEHHDGAGPVNLGSGREIEIAEIAELIASIVGFEGGLRWDSSKPDGQPRRRVDTEKARRAFGFEARTSLEDGLRRTVDWYLSHRDRADASVPI